jgi:hypothetical protein
LSNVYDDNPELDRLIRSKQITTASNINRPRQAQVKQLFEDFNERNPRAGGGMLVEPGFGGVRQGYRSEKAIKAAQQAGNVAKTKARFDKIGKAFIEQDFNALKTQTRPARIAAGAKDAGGILNQADTLLLNNVILGNDVKAQNALAKQLGINRRYMIDTYTEALEFTKAGKSKKQSELRLKRLETQKNLFDEILNNPNATVESMAKKFNKTKKEIVKQSSLLLKNVYDQNVVIGKGDLRDRPLKSWLPDDFNITDNFLDNFSNIKGLRKVQQENIGTLIRDAFGKGQNPKKYTQALAALSEYNKLVNALPKGLKLNLDHPLSKAFLKGSGVSPEKLLYVTPISSDYNRGFKAKLDTAYKNALLNPNKDKKLIKTIENFANDIGVNIGKGSTKKLDFGTTPITKKTKADFAAELTENLKQQNISRQKLEELKKTKEGKDTLKTIFPKGQKVQIPKANLSIIKSIAKLGGGKCATENFASGGRINLADSITCLRQGLENIKNKNLSGGPQQERIIKNLTDLTKTTQGARALGSAARVVAGLGIGSELALGGFFAITDYATGANKQELLSNLTYGLAGKDVEEQLTEKDPMYGKAKELEDTYAAFLQGLDKTGKPKTMNPRGMAQRTTAEDVEKKMEPFKRISPQTDTGQFFDLDMFQRQKAKDIKALEDFEREKKERALDIGFYDPKFDVFSPDRPAAAGGGLLKQAGDRSGAPPKSGPTPHGLPGILKRAMKIKE